MKQMKRKRVDIRRNALYALIVNSVQIIAVWALAALLFVERNGASALAAAAIALIVSLGALLDIREAVAARRKNDQADMLESMVSQMDELNRALRAQRHDFLNHLQVVFSLIEMEEYKEAGDYIERVYGDMQSLSRAMRTDNPAVNALLRAKAAACEEAGVKMEIDAAGSWKNLPMPAWEMCRVFSNLIDNAVDALEGAQDKRLCICLREDLHGFAFSVENNGPMIPPALKKRIFEAGVSSRGAERGMGLFIVKQTLADYGGEISVESDEARTVFSGFVPHLKEQNDAKADEKE